MKNIPRIFLGENLNTGDVVPAAREVSHYLTRVMRRRDFLAFGGGGEFTARISDDGKSFIVGDRTAHADPSGDVILYFAPIKRTDDLVNFATQMGVKKMVPVITARTVANNINWDRMRKIAIEAAEQSNRNSVPEIFAPIKFSDLNPADVVFADERCAYGAAAANVGNAQSVLVGPEGGFSDEEFATLDAGGARGISLGTTILRAELAAAVALSRVMK